MLIRNNNKFDYTLNLLLVKIPATIETFLLKRILLLVLTFIAIKINSK